jgi:hypothetical protein
MLFPDRMHAALRSGAISLTFRNWKRPQVKVGGRYRTGGGDLLVDLVVESMDRLSASDISDADARRAGCADAAALLAERKWPDDAVVYRIAFHNEEPLPPPPPLDLGDDELTKRLARLDAAGIGGAWTRSTLELIARRPAVRAGDLAEELGRERLPFKADVRKLKRLGLTQSLEIGYRLSPRGRAYVSALAEQDEPDPDR